MSQIEQVITRLRSMILGGEFNADERLMEMPIAKELGVSRTPVRIALGALEREGLVTTEGPKRGFVVRSFNLEEVFDAIAIRGVLEGTAARLVAERGASNTVENELRECVLIGERLVETGVDVVERQRAWIDLNSRFHRLIVEASQNDVISGLIERINCMPLASPSAITFTASSEQNDRQRLMRVQEDHIAIVDAIVNRQGMRAEMKSREHALQNIKNKKENFDAMKEFSTSYGHIPGLELIVEN